MKNPQEPTKPYPWNHTTWILRLFAKEKGHATFQPTAVAKLFFLVSKEGDEKEENTENPPLVPEPSQLLREF